LSGSSGELVADALVAHILHELPDGGDHLLRQVLQPSLSLGIWLLLLGSKDGESFAKKRLALLGSRPFRDLGQLTRELVDDCGQLRRCQRNAKRFTG
jgi:hypothetical protein